MSSQTYVDDHLMCEIEGGQHLMASAIVGHDGNVWAQSSNFPQFKHDEITAIMKDFDEPGTLAPTGLHLGGTKYMVIQGCRRYHCQENWPTSDFWYTMNH